MNFDIRTEQRCQAVNRHGEQCGWQGFIYDRGFLICRHHNQKGWVPFSLTEREQISPEMRARAERVIAGL